jgi:hypothetical protein
VVNSHLADLWQISILHVIQTSPRIGEVWQYRPSQAPKRAGNLNLNQEASR